MITKPNWQELEAWIDTPAKKENPRIPDVEILLIGDYSVSGSGGNFYQVIFGQRSDGVFAACTCKGNLHRQACYHIKSAWPIHRVMAEI